MVPSPPKTRIRSTSRERLCTFGETSASNFPSEEVEASVQHCRPARVTSRDACLRSAGVDSFSGLATSPIRLIFSRWLFKQDQKFLVPGRAQNGGLDRATPAKLSAIADKISKLLENPLVNAG